MALYKPSPLINAISGNVGSVNFVAGAQRTTLRAARNPYSPVRAAQLTPRANMQLVVQAWADLDQTSRDSWNTLARQLSRPDRLGQARTLSGRQFFIRYNLRELQNGLTMYTTTAPRVLTDIDWTASIIVATSPTNITWKPSGTAYPFFSYFALSAQAFYRTPPQFIPNRFRWYGLGYTAATGDQQQYPQIINATGELQSGQWFAIHARLVVEGYYYDATVTTTAQIP